MKLLAWIKQPPDSLRDWYDPWIVFGEMIVLSIMAVALMIADISMRFVNSANALSKERIAWDFKDRMHMVYTSVPFYLREVRRVDKYNREV